jgi:diguanylate cyclase (GGDEF)-like protein
MTESTAAPGAGFVPRKDGSRTTVALRTILRCVAGMRTVAVARVGSDGRLVDANRGFRALLGGASRAEAGELARRFVHPTLGHLLARAAEEPVGGIAFAGTLNVVDMKGGVRALQATVVRDGEGLLLVGELDVGGLERLSGALLTLNEELLSRGRELERLNQALLEREAELVRLAATDQLTELPNRRTLAARLDTELALAAVRGTPLSVALADIDHFKPVNDRYGHEVGDAVLRLVARTLRTDSRATDVVGRWGGEEFMLVLPATGLDEAVGVLDRLRARVREQTAASCREPVTMSFGVCEAAPGEGATDVVRRTDNALYAAKAAGRNLVSPWRAGLPRSASAA